MSEHTTRGGQYSKKASQLIRLGHFFSNDNRCCLFFENEMFYLPQQGKPPERSMLRKEIRINLAAGLDYKLEISHIISERAVILTVNLSLNCS